MIQTEGGSKVLLSTLFIINSLYQQFFVDLFNTVHFTDQVTIISYHRVSYPMIG